MKILIVDRTGNLLFLGSSEGARRPDSRTCRHNRAAVLAVISDLWDCMPRNGPEPSDPAGLALLKRLIKAGRAGFARKLLGRMALDNAEACNLCGVVHELQGHFEEARQCYRRALELDATLGAAEINLRRCYELGVSGHSSIPLCL